VVGHLSLGQEEANQLFERTVPQLIFAASQTESVVDLLAIARPGQATYLSGNHCLCKQEGFRVVMLTEDKPSSAEAVAPQTSH